MYSTFPIANLSTDAGDSSNSHSGRACDSCRSLKVKCRRRIRGSDHAPFASEACEECHRNGSRCTFTHKRLKPGRRRTGQSPRARFLFAEQPLDLSPFPASSRINPVLGHKQKFNAADEALSRTIDVPGARISPTQGINESTRFISTPVAAVEDIFADEVTTGVHLLRDDDPVTLDRGRVAPLSGHNSTLDLHWDAIDTANIYYGTALETSPILDSIDAVDMDDIWHSVQKFFEESWVVFPLLSYDSLHNRLLTQPSWETDAAFRTLLLSIRMLNFACEYRLTSKNMTLLLDLVRRVEQSRLDYDFAEPPTLDDAVVSLFLFVAYNVIEKHARAFLYLDEAFSLLEAVEAYSDVDLQRRQLIQQVLFNTEAASIPIYARTRRERRAQRPTRPLAGIPTSRTRDGQSTEYERLALHLVTRLTEIHGATDDARELGQSAGDLEDLRTLCGVSLQRNQYCRIQAADVAVSQQWKLSVKLVASLRNRTATSKTALAEAKSLGVTAMAWVCSLREGELRIVGLGKVSGLVQAIKAIAGNRGCDYVIAGLVGAVIREDHDRKFAAALSPIIAPLTESVPAILGAMPSSLQVRDDIEPREGIHFDLDAHALALDDNAHDADADADPGMGYLFPCSHMPTPARDWDDMIASEGE